MNALLNIQVNVLSRQAIAELRRMQAELSRMQMAQVKGAAGARGFGGALANSTARIEKFGKNLQWSGRQLEYNFTLPLIIAGGMATKWALDNERAMTRVRKVYGDLGEDVTGELKAIERSFELLSNRFGVHLSEVADIGAAWAQAGAAGAALPKAVKSTLEAMILGELEAVDATEKMIAVQSAYRLNTEELAQAISDLNVIENQTSINFGGLIEVITRAGGASRAAGIDLQELAAMASVLVPAAGSASQAGNSLRTMFSRILAPTKQAAGNLKEIGLEIDSVGWLSMDGTERLKALSVAFQGLTQNQKAVVSSTVASRWQINRFNLLMEDVALSLDPATAHLSSYATALEAVSDPQRAAAVTARELSTVLSSSPRAFNILTTNIKNAMAKAIMPLLPTLVALLAEVAKLISKFNELAPSTQKMVLVFALMLAIIGPIGRYVGSLGILFATLGHAVHFAMQMGGFFITAMFGMTSAQIANLTVSEAQNLSYLRKHGIIGVLIKIITGPFVAAWWLLSATITATSGVFSAFFGFVAQGIGALLRIFTTAMMALAGVVGSVVGPALTAAWAATLATMQRLTWLTTNAIAVAWRTLPLIVAIVGQAIATAWATASTLAYTAWISFTSAIPALWRSLPLIAATVGQAVSMAFAAASTVAHTAWVAFSTFVPVLWRTLPLIAGTVGMAIQRAWIIASTVAHSTWIAFTTAVAALWRTLPLIVGAVGMAIQRAWVATTTAMRVVWQASLMAMRAAYLIFQGVVIAGQAIIALAIANPIVAAVAVAVAALVALVAFFRDDIVRGIVAAFQMLPEGIKNTLVTVLRMIQSFALAVYEWLSYLNPFARHSPSLVDSVTRGVSTILEQYQRLYGVKAVLQESIAAHNAFLAATGAASRNLRMEEYGQKKQDIVAVSPNAGPAVDSLITKIWKLKDALTAVGDEILAQEFYIQELEAAVDELMAPWEAALESNKAAQNAVRLEILKIPPALAAVNAQISAQQALVTSLQASVDAAMSPWNQMLKENSLEQKKIRLEMLKTPVKAIEETTAAIKDQGSALDDLYDSIRQAMMPFEDQIFANEMAQKKLRLEILKLNEAGDAVDNLRDRFAALSGEIEKLGGQRRELALAGAGSDILASFDAEIAALEAQRSALEGMPTTPTGGGATSELEAQLKELRRLGEIMELERSIQFDPQLREIDKQRDLLPKQTGGGGAGGGGGTPDHPLQGRLDELQLIAEIAELERDIEMAPLLDQLDAEAAKLKELQDLAEAILKPYNDRLDTLTREQEIMELERDAQMAPLLKQLDEEKAKLEDLKAAYSDISDLINSMEQSLDSMAADAGAVLRDAAKKASGAAGVGGAGELSQIGAGALADYETPEGSAPPGLGREGGLAEIEEFNKAMEAELARALEDMGGIDMLGPFKDMWNTSWKWLKDSIGPYIEPIIGGIQGLFNGVDWGGIWGSITGFFEGLEFGDFFTNLGGGALGAIGDAFESATEIISSVWNTLVDEVGPVISWLIEQISQAGETLGKEFSNWAPLFQPLLDAIQNIFGAIVGVIGYVIPVIQSIIMVRLGIIRAKWEIFWPAIRNAVTAVFDAIVGFIRGALEVVRGIFTVVLALINGDWKLAWEGLLTILDGVWDAIYAIFRGAWDFIYGIVKGLVEGIVSFFQWLYDVLVGNSIIPDMVDAIIAVFNFLKDTVVTIWDALWAAVSWVWENIVKPIWDAIVWTINEVLVPLFEAFKSTFEAIWNAIGAVLKWVWDNIITPVWDAIQWYLDNQLKPAFENFKSIFEAIWNAIGAVLEWVWNEILEPIWNAVIDFVGGVLTDAFEGFQIIFETVWEAIGGAAQWVWDNMLKPTWDAVMKFVTEDLVGAFRSMADLLSGIWDGVTSVISSVWNGIVSTIGSAVNLAIDIINRLSRGIENIAGMIGITIEIGEIGDVSWGKAGLGSGAPIADAPTRGGYASGTNRIPEHPFASGVGAGFKTNRVRAIVGEGNPLYPEYVIPTDPTHRNRALKLAGSLAADLGHDLVGPQYAGGGIPKYFLGGVLDSALELGKGAWDATGGKVVSGIKKGALMAIFSPINEVVKGLISTIPVNFIKDAADSVREMTYNWVTGAEEGMPTAPDLGAGVGWEAMWDAVKSQFPGATLNSSYRPGSVTVSGNQSYHALGRAIDVSPSMDIFNWLHSNYSGSKELIYSPAGGRQLRNGAPHMYTGAVRAQHFNHVHWAMAQGGLIPSLANGGIVMPRPGGTLARLGEAGQAEAVLPLPRDFASGGNEYHFHGDLSFPNIKSGDDAEELIRNLESLVD